MIIDSLPFIFVGLISSDSLITYRVIYIPVFKSGTDERISLLKGAYITELIKKKEGRKKKHSFVLL